MNKPLNRIIFTFIFTILYTILCVWYLGFEWYRFITTNLMVFVIGVVSLAALRKCFYWYSTFMIIGKSTFMKQVDRPRVYLISILLPVLIAIWYSCNSYDPKLIERFVAPDLIVNTLYFFVLLCLFVFLSLFISFAFSTDFERIYLPKLKTAARRLDPDFKSKITTDRAELIFDRLVKYDFLEYDDLTEKEQKKKQFREIFVDGTLPERVAFNLKMDNIQTNAFYDSFRKELPGFSMKHLLTIFSNKNGQPTPNSIRTSASKAPKGGAKKQKFIDEIFFS